MRSKRQRKQKDRSSLRQKQGNATHTYHVPDGEADAGPGLDADRWAGWRKCYNDA
jgi:hypothetical protein